MEIIMTILAVLMVRWFALLVGKNTVSGIPAVRSLYKIINGGRGT